MVQVGTVLEEKIIEISNHATKEKDEASAQLNTILIILSIIIFVLPINLYIVTLQPIIQIIQVLSVVIKDLKTNEETNVFLCFD